MKKKRLKTWLYAAGSLLVIAYLAFAMYYGDRCQERQLCRGVYIQVVDTARQNFVTVDELRNELGSLPMIARRTPLLLINTDSLARLLRVIDKIENVSVSRYTDGSIHIVVEPMRPVARIFEPDCSYYINKDGKRISASARYHVDVPVVQGVFPDTSFTPLALLPLVRYIGENKRWSQLVSMIKVDSPDDVLIIPAVRGLVLNIGRPEELDSKFRRLERMIDEVLPVKGWDYYDTLSVRWRGQVVATRRQKVVRDTLATLDDFREVDDIATMTVGDNVAAGQALPGKKAKSEKPLGAKPFKDPKNLKDPKDPKDSKDSNASQPPKKEKSKNKQI